MTSPMAAPTRLFINGEMRDGSSGERLPVGNPTTEQPIAEVDAASVEDVDAAVNAAQRAFRAQWRDMPPGERTTLMHRIAQVVRDHLEELVQIDVANVGKTVTDARDEAEVAAKIFDYYAGAISRFVGQTIPVASGGLDYTIRQPLGVVATIVPWNFPFPIGCWKLAPALAAGNTVILKPAEQTPLSMLRLAQLIHEKTDIPPGVMQVVPGRGDVAGEALVGHPGVRKVAFTGSVSVGKHIHERCSADLKRVSLELGGKSPNIVFSDANLEKAALSSPMGVFANCGQDCCARSRVLVERSVYDRFVEMFVEQTKRVQVGDPADESTDVGPMITAAQREQVEGFIEEARRNGRTICCGGERPREKGWFVSPTVVTGVEPGDRIWREEVFGPVVCIRPFDDEACAVEEANDTPYGLSGSVWTRDIDRALRVSHRVESGVLGINSVSSVFPEAPFGGFKQSGVGRDLGMAAMEGCTELKNIYIEPDD